MAMEYCVDEFVGITNTLTVSGRGGVIAEMVGSDIEPCTLGDVVDKKISLLYDFCILKHKRYGKPDDREDAVRRFLSQYKSEYSMTKAIHPVVFGECKLNEFLRKKGVI